ncbi:hypothetical protein GCM10025778_13050 [Paeniglutamicibacter antarcticus]|uniref:Uncharacterized protein n=1 Tax=Paeniglutamicibacter antarcticus TaxID=494023 RepID=A0ABP9TJP3_9MICC
MNPLEPNAYEIILYVVGATFVILLLWVLIKVGKYVSKRSKMPETISSSTTDEESDA